MKLADSRKTRFDVRALVTIFIAAGLASCGSTGRESIASVPAVTHYGPQADYPILVCDPYEVAGTTYTPADVLNYDEVGYLALDPGAMGYSGAHHTLPVPSYVEVTSLETGRTVLIRLESRGPMATNHIVALSPAAMAQLGADVETPVRVRRVNPPEEQRAMLRRGDAAPLRMDTPSSLLTVLQRRLPESGTASLAASAETPTAIENVPVAASTAKSNSLSALEPPATMAQASPQTTEPAPAEGDFVAAFDADTSEELSAQQNEPAELADASTQPAPVLDGGFVVQAAAFANPDNARRAANALGGTVQQSGEYYRVRTGPFATRGEAEASLANVRDAGYSDARILTSG